MNYNHFASHRRPKEKETGCFKRKSKIISGYVKRCNGSKSLPGSVVRFYVSINGNFIMRSYYSIHTLK